MEKKCRNPTNCRTVLPLVILNLLESMEFLRKVHSKSKVELLFVLAVTSKVVRTFDFDCTLMKSTSALHR